MSTPLSIIKSTAAMLTIVSVVVAVPSSSVYAASASGLAHGQGYGLTQTQPSHTSDQQSSAVGQTPAQSTEQTSANTQNNANASAGAAQAGTSQPSSVQAKGNNGTIKIHEAGTPNGTENNDPKVCSFNVEGFGFDASQTGYLQFDVQGGDKPTGTASGPYAFGPTNAAGFYASQYFHLVSGHYKATLYGKMLPGGQLSDIKAKSKVFKVQCDAPAPPKSCPAGTTWNDRNNNKKVDSDECVAGGRGGNENGTTDSQGQVLGATTTSLVNTGDNATVLVAEGAAVIALALLANILVQRKS